MAVKVKKKKTGRRKSDGQTALAEWRADPLLQRTWPNARGCLSYIEWREADLKRQRDGASAGPMKRRAGMDVETQIDSEWEANTRDCTRRFATKEIYRRVRLRELAGL